MAKKNKFGNPAKQKAYEDKKRSEKIDRLLKNAQEAGEVSASENDDTLIIGNGVSDLNQKSKSLINRVSRRHPGDQMACYLSPDLRDVFMIVNPKAHNIYTDSDIVNMTDSLKAECFHALKDVINNRKMNPRVIFLNAV